MQQERANDRRGEPEGKHNFRFCDELAGSNGANCSTVKKISNKDLGFKENLSIATKEAQERNRHQLKESLVSR